MNPQTDLAEIRQELIKIMLRLEVLEADKAKRDQMKKARDAKNNKK